MVNANFASNPLFSSPEGAPSCLNYFVRKAIIGTKLLLIPIKQNAVHLSANPVFGRGILDTLLRRYE